MRLLAIGDIHGSWRALQALAAAVDFQADDVIVTLGDYVDRGPHTKEVIQYLLDLGSWAHLIPLRGNHEVMMLAAREKSDILPGWLDAGGVATLQSYHAKSWDDIPPSHWAFLERTQPFYEAESDFFVHASARPDLPLAAQDDDSLYWERFGSAAPHRSGKRMICGHTAQRSGLILNLDFAVCIDTWACGRGWLTCLDAKSNHYWQANERGKVRTGELGK